MIIKQREVPHDLRIMRYLFYRGALSNEEKHVLSNLEKGFEGELKFDSLLEESLSSEWLIIKDLLLQTNNSLFQIDTLHIVNGKIYFFDVKNYEGESYIEGEQWFSLSGTEIKNPLQQLHRGVSLLRQLLQSLGLTLPMESYVVFVHSEFTLFQAPRNLPIILPSQIPRFLNKLKIITPRHSQSDLELANKLRSLHITESPYSRVPTYRFEQLKKGLYCCTCHAFSLRNSGRKLVCQTCGFEESLEDAIMRGVKEFHELFPERAITVGAIKEWCGLDVSRKTIGYILKKNLVLINKRGYSFYIYPEKN